MDKPDVTLWTGFASGVFTAVSALVGAISHGVTWRKEDGRIRLSLIVSGLATAIMLAEIVGAACEWWGVSIKIQLGLAAGVGYVGPAAFLPPLKRLILGRLGVPNDPADDEK